MSSSKSHSRNPATPRERPALRRGSEARRLTAFPRRALLIGSVTTVLALGGGIGIGLGIGGDDAGSGGVVVTKKLVVPAHSGGVNGTVITYGKGKASDTVQVFEDLRCPYCASLERTLGGTLTSMADSGKVKVEYRMAAFLDKRLGGQGSKTGLAALGAALDEGTKQFKAYHDALFAAQPKNESTDTFGSSATLLDIASKVPGLRTPSFNKAVKEGTYLPWATKVADAFYTTDVTGTPTVKVNGKVITVLGADGKPVSVQRFIQAVQAALAAS
jgi:protein-disulfide isomerase